MRLSFLLTGMSSVLRFLIFLTCTLLPAKALASPTTAPTGTSSQQTAPILNPSVLGDGRGIDHLVVAVRDLEAAKDTYRDLLGFKLPPEARLGFIPQVRRTVAPFSITKRTWSL